MTKGLTSEKCVTKKLWSTLIEKIDFSILKLLFQIYAILNFSLKDEFLELKDGNFFANLQKILPTCFIVNKRQSCSLSVNNAKKHEHEGDVKCR